MDSTPELEITELVDLSTIKNKGKRKALAKKMAKEKKRIISVTSINNREKNKLDRFIENKKSLDKIKETLNIDDEALAENVQPSKEYQSWDDLYKINDECLNCILEVGEKIKELIYSSNNIPAVCFEDIEGFNNNLKVIANDIQLLGDKIYNLRNAIGNRKGFITSEKDISICLSSFNDHTDLFAEIQTILMPTICNITSAYEKAKINYKEILDKKEGDSNGEQQQ